MPREKKPEPVVDESKRWLDSYADAITLLMAFFVMLFAFSLVDQTKFEAFRRGLTDTFGRANPVAEGGIGLLVEGDGVAELVTAPPTVTETGNQAEGEADTDEPGQGSEAGATEDALDGVSEIATEDQADALQQEIEERLLEINAEEFVEVTRDERGVVITFDEVVLFPSGRATINMDGQVVLSTVAQVLTPFSNQIEVEGHTDSVPISSSAFPTNWELGAARAVNVTRYFAEVGGVPAAQLRAVSFGEYRPRDTNDTEAGRAANRRVEVVVVVAEVPAAEPDLTDGLFGLGATPLHGEHTASGDRPDQAAGEQAEQQAVTDQSTFPRPSTPPG